MKLFLYLITISFSTVLYAQTDEAAIKKSIYIFFEGMETNDTAKIRSIIDETCFLKTLAIDKTGKTVVEEEKIDNFFEQVIKFKGVKVKEELLSFDIKVDGVMATAWVPYKIYFNDKFSHCGVNSFTMVKQGNSWKILGIIDTRRRQGCELLK